MEKKLYIQQIAAAGNTCRCKENKLYFVFRDVDISHITTFQSKEEMEKHMLNEEVARIESMIMGLETAVAAIQETESAVIHRFDELTESVSSSMMFSTNELNRARSKITDHLSRMKEDDEIQPLIAPIPKPKQPEAVKVKQKERGKKEG